MAYNRAPSTIIAGRALKQTPPPSVLEPAGVVTLVVDADIATTTSCGVVQIGSGLSITPTGVLSATSSGGLINVKLTAIDYLVADKDYYIGATNNNIKITLPLGILGKVYVIKNQSSGNIKIDATNGETLDSSNFKTIGSEAAIIVVFDGTRWNII